MINLYFFLFIFLNILRIFKCKKNTNDSITIFSNNLTDNYIHFLPNNTTPIISIKKNKKSKKIIKSKKLKKKNKIKNIPVLLDDKNLFKKNEIAFNNFNDTTIIFSNATVLEKENKINEVINNDRKLVSTYLNKTCILYTKENPCIPPFQKFNSRFRVDTIHNVNYCTITKNFSSMLRAILCFIKKPHYVKYQKDLTKGSWIYKFCNDNNFSRKISQIANNYTNGNVEKLMNEWKHVAFVRDPYERFISAFVDKCIVSMEWKKQKQRCYGCKSNLNCVLEKMYKRLIEITRFPKKKIIITYDDVHFFPQSWHCEFKKYLKSYIIIKYGSEPKVLMNFYKQLFEILNERGVSKKKIKYIRKYTEKRRTRHATYNLWVRKYIEKKIKKNSYLTKMLYRIFYYDFVVFNFTLPSIPK